MQPMVAMDPIEACVTVPVTAHTLDGFRAWQQSDTYPGRRRIDFCEGEVLVDMSPERAESHSLVKGAIHVGLARVVEAKNLGILYPDGPRLTNHDASIVTEPDGMFVSWESLATGRAMGGNDTVDPLGILGSPDWVLEVVSPSSVQKDRHRWLHKYAVAGVREYWVADAREGLDLSIYILDPESDTFRLQPRTEEWQRSEVFDTDVRLQRATRDKRTLYRLETR